MTTIPEEFNLQSYDFDLPESQIAQDPAERRGASRLLVLDRASGEVRDCMFADIAQLLPRDALLVVNNTKVLPARLIGRKESGGKAEFLLLTPLSLIEPEARTDGWSTAEVEGLLKASKGPRPGERLHFDGLELLVLEKGEFGRSRVRLNWRGELADHFLKQGHIPLPPYIRREDKGEDRDRYQTVYSREDKLGSVAAPTAGLHFTPEIMAALEARGIRTAEVTLYVGYGTFSPVRCDDIREHVMHAEYAEVPEETAGAIARARAEGRPVVAVGTTTTRTLESMASHLGGIGPFRGWTDIFIRPGYSFKVVDQLITNFHLPRSSLIIMVSTLAGRRQIIDAYNHAVRQGFRFFSYGDAMLIR
ncbi:tRNA preQ1(34) S-adenosylmethionine ribosyltransferase-isomerase QueA [Desulfomicrobium escambiense]|uniref:tRNA preQ1(34) S-adenosylmethionine ribosyltransferase-isomerase QueA n=1 Tax=Desulfomicrobium escambiense TaxID=29503 RepID=UPI000428E29A|nr:tRNA preQ1(34) S-adenosylmethionine ribosyltransferase-isomerase QueA [Desulfomicrobium escambiense]